MELRGALVEWLECLSVALKVAFEPSSDYQLKTLFTQSSNCEWVTLGGGVGGVGGGKEEGGWAPPPPPLCCSPRQALTPIAPMVAGLCDICTLIVIVAYAGTR